MFLSAMTAEQDALETAIRSALRIGESDAHPAVSAFRHSASVNPESSSHIGIRYRSLAVARKCACWTGKRSGTRGRAARTRGVDEIRAAARRGRGRDDSAVVAEQIADLTAFSGDETPSFAPHWIQCFVSTDLCGFGILAFGTTFELDYVFEPFLREPPSFGRRAG